MCLVSPVIFPEVVARLQTKETVFYIIHCLMRSFKARWQLDGELVGLQNCRLWFVYFLLFGWLSLGSARLPYGWTGYGWVKSWGLGCAGQQGCEVVGLSTVRSG